MNGQLLHFTLRELQSFAQKPRLWLVFGIVVALFTVTGPFGTISSLSAPVRAVYWLVLHAAAWTLALLFVSFGNVALKGRLEPALLRTLVSAALASIPIGVAISLANAAFLDKPVTLGALPESVATALPVSLALAWLTSLSLDGKPEDEAPGQMATPGPADAATALSPAEGRPDSLIERLPPAKRAPLIRLEVQDHYVLVVTEKGQDLLLIRLGDAMREASGGMQVHRSHWVAFDGVETLEREGGRNPRLTLRMKDGAEIPVSRSYAAEVRARFG